ncbi:hypothetical protein [Paracoccus alkenifer]|uniref:hypothetical protein n=1 Tax=Paracoccus alkenifer TaxID=65735 RepID=UPI00115FB51A|nr:hypothetical protein [Paracoccus alkenifer]
MTDAKTESGQAFEIYGNHADISSGASGVGLEMAQLLLLAVAAQVALIARNAQACAGVAGSRQAHLGGWATALRRIVIRIAAATPSLMANTCVYGWLMDVPFRGQAVSAD